MKLSVNCVVKQNRKIRKAHATNLMKQYCLVKINIIRGIVHSIFDEYSVACPVGQPKTPSFQAPDWTGRDGNRSGIGTRS